VRAVGLYALVGVADAGGVGLFYVGGNGVAAAIGLAWSTPATVASADTSLSGRATRDGLYFALSQWMQAVQKDSTRC